MVFRVLHWTIGDLRDILPYSDRKEAKNCMQWEEIEECHSRTLSDLLRVVLATSVGVQ